jgi:DNA-directed RNA polymerase subunit RPC12/RpoP
MSDVSDVRCPYCDHCAPYGDFVTKAGYKCPRCEAEYVLRLGQLLPLGLYSRQRKQEKSEEGREDLLSRIEEMVAGISEMLTETYESIQTLRKAVAIVQTLQEEQLENPQTEMKKIGLRHEEWDGKSPHPYGCVEQLDGDLDDAGDELGKVRT